MLKIAFDRVDITPDDNGWIGFAAPGNPQPERDPLYGRLFLLQSSEDTALIISLDYGGLYCSAHDLWRAELAEAMGIAVNQVILHCVHQHDAPFINIEAAEIMGANLDWTWFDTVKSNVKKAALGLKDKLQTVAEIGWSETRVYGYASNRRVPMEDGSIAVRFSRCIHPEVKNKPVGLIDPMLRTLGFYSEDGKLMAAWSFYATHPQVANEGKRFSADAPGEAMRLLEARMPKVMHSLFNGFFGNLTAGKYTSCDDLEGNIKKFGKILADAIELNSCSMERKKADSFSWKRECFEFPVRHFDMSVIDKPQTEISTVEAAMAAGERYGEKHGEEYALELLQINDAKMLFVNGELFIEYQLYAQSLIPDEKLAVVGNCGDSFYYIGTAEALKNPEGYEVKSFCRVMPDFENLSKAAVGKLLM